ncbi:zinc ABC transporter substrate-binding protein [Pelagibacterium xiamenense]|uniref:zinc ABC transporter substrate-binding protein n=1 Tax=Pelagibacterium xiamenense TaxID=2901140 RepID=UPI001E5BF7E6|nr:zinc ABC transporter substrate-binding protein [Pelagibacterium xiamenense]MCD7058824.1 zinc ABC transporter substrate-binding protein [Pelagibacterium xiamenense]
MRAARLIAPALVALVTSPAVAAPNVVASIKPLHSLVAAVMDGVGEPALLVQGAASPHGFSLRPSDAAALENADIVFWVGENLETFLPGPLATLSGDATAVEMLEIEGLTLLETREGGLFEAHSHDHDNETIDDHHAGDDDHADHDDGADDDHDHDDHAHEDHAHDDDAHEEHAHDAHDHDHGGINGHIWLDTQNARLMVAAITDALIEADPENAEIYNANGLALSQDLSALEDEISATLDPLAGTPYFVFHDAYHYFGARFGVEATGSFTVNPEIAPGAGRLSEIQDTLAETGATCVFTEPQFSPALVETIADATGARIGVLDPLGADLADGPELYPQLIRNLAANLADCLSS